MTLTTQEISEFKSQLRQQIQHLPESQKIQAQQQIDSLSPEALEEMLKQQSQDEKTIFRMIVDKDVPSVKIDEDDFALAVLDINPISEGHTLIIPKKPVSGDKEMPKEVTAFAKKILDKILAGTLGAKSVESISETKFNEKIINLIPIYDSHLNLSSPRKKSDKSGLEFVAQKFEPPKKTEVIKIETKKNSPDKVLKLKRRIP